MDAVLEARGITKRFPGTVALDAVDFTLARGEVHALLGENGAGKSTLIKCLTGAYARDGGTVLLDGLAARDAELDAPLSGDVSVEVLPPFAGGATG